MHFFVCLVCCISLITFGRWRRSGVFIVNFEHISHFSAVSIVNFEHIIADWEKVVENLFIY